MSNIGKPNVFFVLQKNTDINVFVGSMLSFLPIEKYYKNQTKFYTPLNHVAKMYVRFTGNFQ